MIASASKAGVIRAVVTIALCLVIAAGGPTLVNANGNAGAGVGEVETDGVDGLWETRASDELDVMDLASAIRAAMLASPDVSLARIQLLEAELSFMETQSSGFPPESTENLEARHALARARGALLESLADAAVKAQEAFFAVVRTHELLEFQQRRVEQAKSQLALAGARHRSGSLSRLDLLKVELDYDRAGGELQDAIRRHEASLRTLSAQTGLDPLPPLAWSEEDFAYSPVEVSLRDALAYAQQMRPDIANARYEVEESRRRLEHARIAGLPLVQRSRIELSFERARIRLEQAIQRAEEEVRQRWGELQQADSAVTLSKKALALAEQRLQVAQARYDAGAVSLMELFSAETDALQAGLDARQALWDYNLKKARFLLLAGQEPPLLLPAEMEEFFSSGSISP